MSLFRKHSSQTTYLHNNIMHCVYVDHTVLIVVAHTVYFVPWNLDFLKLYNIKFFDYESKKRSERNFDCMMYCFNICMMMTTNNSLESIIHCRDGRKWLEWNNSIVRIRRKKHVHWFSIAIRKAFRFVQSEYKSFRTRWPTISVLNGL